MSLDAAWALDWTHRAAVMITENRAELTELDRAIGDADHGDNLDRGMRAVVTKLDAAQKAGNLPATPGGVLKVVATTLMATVGGAGGPLLGTAFLRAARSSDASAWGTENLVRALEEATGRRPDAVADGQAAGVLRETPLASGPERSAHGAEAAGAEPSTRLLLPASAIAAGSPGTVSVSAAATTSAPASSSAAAIRSSATCRVTHTRAPASGPVVVAAARRGVTARPQSGAVSWRGGRRRRRRRIPAGRRRCDAPGPLRR